MKNKKNTISINESQLRDMIAESIKKVLNETSFDTMKYDKIAEYRQTSPDELSDIELRQAIDYMLAYRWALDGDEEVLQAYIEEGKRRGISQ